MMSISISPLSLPHFPLEIEISTHNQVTNIVPNCGVYCCTVLVTRAKKANARQPETFASYILYTTS